VKIDQLDHFVLTVRDVEATCDFYVQVLGMEKVVFGNGRIALLFNDQKINLHQVDQEFEPKAQTPTSGSADFCLITRLPIEQVVTHLQQWGVSIEEGPVQRTGAKGKMQSVYVRDPDLNLVEIAVYEAG